MILSGIGWEDPALPSTDPVGEGYDVTVPIPPGVQYDLVKAIHAVGNTGRREGKEVVQVYYLHQCSSVVTPMKRLVRFQKVPLQPGESRQVEFSIPAAEVTVWNMDMKVL